jgi:hypothetical protein
VKFDGFIGPSYSLEAPSANAQRALNVYPELQEAGPRKQNQYRYVGCPGLRRKATLGSGPLRGVHWSSTGQLFVVSGSRLYEVTADWTSHLRPGSLNSSSGWVSMADNGITLMIGSGQVIACTADLAFGSGVGPAADADCPGGHVTAQDGYFINTVPGTNEFQISGLNDVTYDPLDVAAKEGRPDFLVTALSVNRLLWLFGRQTSEVWWNSGGADFPFARNESAFIETGALSAGSCVRAAGSVAWLGNDERGKGTVWHAQGFTPQRISTHAVEMALSRYSSLEQAFAFSYQQRGHEFYQLTVPASDIDNGGTWVFDFSTGQWHERSYLDPSTGEQPHRASCGTVAFGEVVVGDREDGRLYVYDLDYFTDDGDPIRRVRQSPHLSQEEKRLRFNSFELQAEPGVGLQVAPSYPEWTNATAYQLGNYVTNVGNLYVCTRAGTSIISFPAWQAAHAYVEDDKVQIGGNLYNCFSAGTSAASGGPTGTGSGISDGSVVWNYLQPYGPTGTGSSIVDGSPLTHALWNYLPGLAATPPLVSLSWSNDGGHTWGNLHTTSMGRAGEYKTRLKWHRLGVSRDRVFRVETSEPVRVVWLGAELGVEELDS